MPWPHPPSTLLQVDLIDFQSFPDGDFSWLLVYQDHGTKYVMLVPMVSKRKDSVAAALLRIFTVLGAPAILQSDNGREFYGAARRQPRDEAETSLEVDI